MDLSLLQEKTQRVFSEYLRWLLNFVASPRSIIEETQHQISGGTQFAFLFRVLIISIFIGATIGALIPDRPPIQSRATIFVTVSVLWLFLSALVHVVCRMLGGSQSMQMTTFLMVQNLSFAYVASNLLTLIVWSLIKALPQLTSRSELLSTSGPGGILLSLQFLLLLYLVPLTVSYAHGFRGARRLVTAFAAACFVVAFGLPVVAAGGCSTGCPTCGDIILK